MAHAVLLFPFPAAAQGSEGDSRPRVERAQPDRRLHGSCCRRRVAAHVMADTELPKITKWGTRGSACRFASPLLAVRLADAGGLRHLLSRGCGFRGDV